MTEPLVARRGPDGVTRMAVRLARGNDRACPDVVRTDDELGHPGRSREFAADASGAEVTGDPEALALQKIEQSANARPLAPSGRTGPVSAMMIADPFSARSAMRWFSTPTPPSAWRACGR